MILALITLLSAVIAVVEVSIFSMMGTLVDWLAKENREASSVAMAGRWQHAAPDCTRCAGLTSRLGVGVPPKLCRQFFLCACGGSAFVTAGAEPDLFQNDMAGRIATTVMQTALAVREATTKLVTCWSISWVYVLSALIYLASADWRLALPLFIWALTYLATLIIFIPRLGQISEAQADARARMTGRVVDSYTNIATVKLFAIPVQKRIMRGRAWSRSWIRFTARCAWSRCSTHCASAELPDAGSLGRSFRTALAWRTRHNRCDCGGDLACSSCRACRNGSCGKHPPCLRQLGTVRDGASLLSRPLTVTDRSNAGALPAVRGELRLKP